MLHFVVRNVTKDEKTFCLYHTPFEGIQNDIFDVALEGREIPYKGMMKKRVPPTINDHITLNSDEHSACSCELSGYSLKKSGLYSIQFPGNMISKLPSSNICEFRII